MIFIYPDWNHHQGSKVTSDWSYAKLSAHRRWRSELGVGTIPSMDIRAMWKAPANRKVRDI